MSKKYWVASNDAPFNSIYWSSSSGGPSGAGVPGPLDSAIFDSNSGPCTIDTTVTVSNLILANEYPNSINYTNPIITKGLTLAGGYLTTIDSSVSVSGDVSCLAGFGNSSLHNNAIIIMDSSNTQFITTGGIFPNLIIDTSAEVKLTGPNPFYLSGSLFVKDGTFNTNGLDINLTGFVKKAPKPPPVLPFHVDFSWGQLPPFNVDFSWGQLPPFNVDFSWGQLPPFNVDFSWNQLPPFNVDFSWGQLPPFNVDFSWGQIPSFIDASFSYSQVGLYADFTGNPRILTLPSLGYGTVDFTNTTIGIPVSYYWDFGDGNNSILQNPSHPYQNTAPSFPVSLTVTDTDGSSSVTKPDFIQIITL